MQTTIDSVGRIVVPKVFRDALGLRAGSTVALSLYGSGLALIPTSRTARLRTVDGELIATPSTTVDDEMVFGLIDAQRR